MAALLFDVATRPEYLQQVKHEFAGIKGLYSQYETALKKAYTVPTVAEPK